MNADPSVAQPVPQPTGALGDERSGQPAFTAAGGSFERPDAVPNVARLLRLRVPVLVRLAQRRMPISAVRDLSIGSVVEFDKSVDMPLDLLVNNHLIGHGVCVKAGENFGLRLTEICDQRQRVLSLAD
jgi:flagellar motor switch protein FliN/FliY